jgi:RNA polymerase sigma-70 factor (ECF subfamily)
LRLLEAQAGAPASLERLFGELRPWWLGLAGRLVRRHEEAEEVVQDASLCLFRRLDRFDPAKCRRAKNWLARLLVNCALDHLRRRRRVVPLPDLDPLAWPGEGPDELAERRDQAEHLRRLLDELPPRDREALLLRFEQGLTYQQIGARLGIRLLAAYRLVNKALEKLACRLGAVSPGRAA